MDTDSEGLTPVALRTALVHRPVSGSPIWNSAAFERSISVSIRVHLWLHWMVWAGLVLLAPFTGDGADSVPAAPPPVCKYESLVLPNGDAPITLDRKSTRLNSSHLGI